MNLWEWLQYTVWDIQGRLGNESAASHADALWTVTHATSGQDKLINDSINAQKITFTGFLGALDDVGSGFKKLTSNIWNTLNSLVKNLPLILILALVVAALYFVVPILKKKQA